MTRHATNSGTRGHRAAYIERLDAITAADCAWFGGWLSADGSIKPTDTTARIRFTICDKDPLDRMAALFGNTVSPPQKPTGWGKRPRYIWGIGGWCASQLLKRCLPWLSDRYRERAEISIPIADRTRKPRKLTVEQVVVIKAALLHPYHGLSRKLARQYGVSDGMIASIKRGTAWQDV